MPCTRLLPASKPGLKSSEPASQPGLKLPLWPPASWPSPCAVSQAHPKPRQVLEGQDLSGQHKQDSVPLAWPTGPSTTKGYSTNSMGLLVSCSMALVSTKDDISKHLFLSKG